jgi:hypothetical protein
MSHGVKSGPDALNLMTPAAQQFALLFDYFVGARKK